MTERNRQLQCHQKSKNKKERNPIKRMLYNGLNKYHTLKIVIVSCYTWSSQVLIKMCYDFM